jgi:biopolymer transport protein TolR
MNDINVVPYIDVMLVLLIIFMVTSPMMIPGQVDLPKVGKALPTSVAPLEVIIKKDTSLALRDHAESSDERSVSRDELIDIIREKQANNNEQAVVISADKSVRYEEVVAIMDILQQQNINKVGLLMQTGGK